MRLLLAGGQEFCLLGPLVVRCGGVVVPVPRGKQRAVLAVLLLNGNRVVSLDELAETLWGSDPPVSARVAAQNYVMRLRKLLRNSGSSRISTLPNGYMLRVEAGELDVARFEAHLRAARTAARGGNWDAAVIRARAALALWRGAALEDVESESLALREVPRLAEMRLQAFEACYDAELHLGRPGEVVAELRQLASAHPLREHLHALLMLALYHDDRQAEALAAYQAARRILIDELGTEPGGELRNLHRQILTADLALQLPGPGDGARPTGAGGPGVRCSLPPDTAVFTGRSAELDAITRAVTGAAGAGGAVGIQVIGGMPGAGKTTLAVHTAHMLAAQFPDRQLFIDLHAHTPGHDPVRPVDALAGLLAATGVDPRFLPADLDGRAALWRDRMARQRAVLVLDNAASSAQVTPLLPGGRCLVLVTSRRHLGDLPGAVTQIPVGVLLPDEAAGMFTRLAPRAAGDRDGVAEVVALAGFLPLAVCLLARVFARHPCWSVADLAAGTRARLLTLAAEHSSVAAAFEVSYQNLDPVSQRFFRLLGTHPGTAADAWAAAALAGTGPDRAAARLEALHGEGLLTETGYCRYGMHDLIRWYARDLAAAHAAGDSEQALARLLDYYEHTAARAARRLARQTRPGREPAAPAGFEVPVLDDYGRAMAWARGERASLLACLDLAAGTGQHARVVALTAGLAPVLGNDGPWSEALARHASAAEAARHLGDRLAEANALADLGDVRMRQDDCPAAARVLQEALGIYQTLGDRLGEANVLRWLGIAWVRAGDYPGAAQALEEALGIYSALGDRLGEANALSNLGTLRFRTGDYLGATAFFEQALGIFRALGDRWGEVSALQNLGCVRQETGDFASATSDLDEALGMVGDLGERVLEASVLNELAIVRRRTGDYQGAAEVLGQAQRICRELGSRFREAHILHELGAVRRLTHDHQGATRDLEEALSIFRACGYREGEAKTLSEQGALHQDRGDLAQARDCHQQALELARAIGSPRQEAYALAGLGRCALTADHIAEAGILLRQAQEMFRRIGAAETTDILTDISILTRRETGQQATPS